MMQRWHGLYWVLMIAVCSLGTSLFTVSPPTQARAADAWWNDAWPYRLPVEVSGSGIVEVAIDFTASFDALGLNGGLLDVRSLRVVPYVGTTPGDALPYQESYSTMLDDADNPQTEWSDSGTYWQVNDGQATADTTRASQGSGSLQAVVENRAGGYGYPGVELRIADSNPLTDWRAYETLLYDVWPEVNASALDQAPDLYSFKLYNTNGCDDSSITQGGHRWRSISGTMPACR